MQTLTRPKRPQTMLRPPRARRKRFSPLMLIGAAVTMVIVVGAAAYTVMGKGLFGTHAAAANPNCTIMVPANPLTAQGLATPYVLFAPDAAANGPCNEANANQSAFVQATIFDPNTDTFSVYSPLVIDQGTQPAVAPVVPTLPAGAVVGIWFGFNGTNLTQMGATATALQQGNCVNGLAGSVFGQFSYCDAPQFFGAVNQAIGAGNLAVPPLGIGNDGLACPSTRDFSVIDQDQSDNVQTQYLANANGQTAQFSAANQAQLAGATTLNNPSDNALISKLLDPPLGCTPWMAPDLTNAGALTPALALDEIQAAADQTVPVALVPANDPMVLNNNNESLQKVNLYREGVDQPVAVSIPGDANPTSYCANEFANPSAATGLIRLVNDSQNFFQNVASPMPAAANNMANFLLMRSNQSFTNLGCNNLLNIQDPVNLVTDGNGVVIGATVTLPGGGTAAIGQQAAPAPAPTPAPPANGNGGGTAATPTPAPGNGAGGGTAATPTPAPGNGAGGTTPPPASGNGTGGTTPPPAGGTTPNGGNTSSGGTTNSGGNTSSGGTTANGGGVYTTVPGVTDTGSTAQGGDTTTGTQQTSTAYTATGMQSTSLEVVQLFSGVFLP